MKKWVIFSIIAVVFVGIGASGFLYSKQALIIQNYEARIVNLQTDIVGMENQITSLTGTIQTLTGNVSSLSASTSNLQNDLVSIKEGITSLAGTIQTLDGSVSSLTDLATNLQHSQNSSDYGLGADFIKATDRIKPAVVVIETQKVTTTVTGRRSTQRSRGSGWIIKSEGLIVTNNHVIADAISIKVTLADGRVFPSIAVQTDSATDLAVIKIDANNLPVVVIGDSDRLQVGQPVAAIGNSLGRGINMTGGWVSRLNTSITFRDGRRMSGLIGTDAAINPGNSGGPLITINGEVVGITNAKLVQTSVEGTGYAISISNAIETINDLIAKL